MNLKKIAIVALSVFAVSEIALSLFVSEAEAAAAASSRRRRANKKKQERQRRNAGYYAETQSQAQSHFNGF